MISIIFVGLTLIFGALVFAFCVFGVFVFLLEGEFGPAIVIGFLTWVIYKIFDKVFYNAFGIHLLDWVGGWL